MQNPTPQKLKGISGVVIAVLLTVIGIAAVLIFWGMMSGFFNPQPKVIIEKAVITKIGQNKYDVSITVRETGGASTTITKVELTGGTLSNPVTLTPGGQTQQKTELSPGSSLTLVYKLEGQSLEPGVTYYIAVYYRSGDSEVRSELYPVTVR